MNQKYYPPTYNSQQFHCVHCNVFAKQHWSADGFFSGMTYSTALHFKSDSPLKISRCSHCLENTLWFEEKIIVPNIQGFIQAHEDMPEEIKRDFQEAISIVNKSPRGAAALLRLVIQKLMIEIGEKGENINQDIANLFKKGLHPHIQQALDYCRVVGNNAVHPGEIKLDDSPEVAQTLFEMINLIIEELIARPKRAQELFANLPEGARKAIEKRDSK